MNVKTGMMLWRTQLWEEGREREGGREGRREGGRAGGRREGGERGEIFGWRGRGRQKTRRLKYSAQHAHMGVYTISMNSYVHSFIHWYPHTGKREAAEESRRRAWW